MSIFKKIFGKMSGGGEYSGRAIDGYTKSLHEHLDTMQQHIGDMVSIAENFMRVDRDSREYAEKLDGIRNEGDAAILENAPHLQPIADELRTRQLEVTVLIKQMQMAQDKLRDGFSSLAADAQQIPGLSEDDKQQPVKALEVLAQHSDHMRQLVQSLPADTRETEHVIAQAAKNIAQAEQDSLRRMHRAAFNDALQNGLRVKKTVSAPTTARFKSGSKQAATSVATY